MDQRTRKSMTMHKVLYLSDGIDKLYVSRTKNSVDISIRRLKDYIKKNKKKRLIAMTRNNMNNISINRTKISRKQKWEEKVNVWIFQATNERNFTRDDLFIAREMKKKKTLKYEGDDDRTVCENLEKELVELEIRKRIEPIQITVFLKSVKYLKNPGNQWRLAVTQTAEKKSLQLEMVRKNSQRIK